MAKADDQEMQVMEAEAAHPRQHSLAMASADTLHKAGYISSAHHERIRAAAGKKLDTHKKAKEAAFGSLAPESAGHYLVPEDDRGGA